jgi:hypothetical protein
MFNNNAYIRAFGGQEDEDGKEKNQTD